jgi:hypothetical protein
MQQNNCINSKLWTFIYKLKKTNPHKKIVLTPEQIFAICNYMNGKPYDRKILQEFI